MTKRVVIGDRVIGLEWPVYFVADIAANHDGSFDRAVELIHLAAEAGAEAAKFQNFRAETIVSDAGFKALGAATSHQAAWDKSVFEVYEEASLPIEWTEALADTCRAAGIHYFTAPYDLDFVDALAPHVMAWKVGSGDLTFHALIERLASDGKPVLIATGASTMAEVEAAVDIALARNPQVVLMQCNTNYTTSPENFSHLELNVLRTYAERYPDVVLGLSDHTPGHTSVLGAVALGARVVEKHFTDDRTRSGPDHAFSMDPSSWREMVDRTRDLEAALGEGVKRVMPNEDETVVLQRRALRAARDIDAGETLQASDIAALRPCPSGGIPPSEVERLVGRKSVRRIALGECITSEDVA